MGFAGPVAPAAAARRRARQGGWGDRIFRYAVFGVALGVAALLGVFLYVLIVGSVPSFQAFGWSFLVTNVWDENSQKFGAAAFIYGTAVTASLALVMGVPVSLGIAIFLTEVTSGSTVSPRWRESSSSLRSLVTFVVERLPAGIKVVLTFLVELLAAVPSVIYGLWAFFVLAPIMLNYVQPALQGLATWHIGAFVPFAFLAPLFFPGNPFGTDKLTASVILALMIIPTITAISREAFAQVPQSQREGAMSLGATSWETTTTAVIPFARTGIFAGIILGLGRAIGETMAVTMTIGNSNTISTSLLQPGQTIPSLIANYWGEALPLEKSSLLELGLVLMAVSLVINVVARLMIRRLVGGGKDRE